MNRPQTVQPPRRAPRWLRVPASTALLFAVVSLVYGAGSLLESVVTQAVVS